MLYLLLSYGPSVLCGIHAIRTGRGMFWLWILVIAPIIGPLIYLGAVMIPEVLQGRTARSLGAAATQAINREKEYRAAIAAVDDVATPGNLERAAKAALKLGRLEEAESLYGRAAIGLHADDPSLVMGRVEVLLELKKFEQALALLEKLPQDQHRTGPTALAFARAYEGLGRIEEAEAPYRYAADRVPGLEAGARYVAFLARAGKKEEAQIGLGEIEKRFAKIAPRLRKDAKPWRDLAASAVRGA